MLVGAPGATVDVAEGRELRRLNERLAGIPASAAACVWVERAGRPSPVLAFDGVSVIADHLVAWAEGEPQAWFELCVREHGGRYAVALTPKVDRSLERFRIAFQLRYEFPMPRGATVTVACRPLHFISSDLGVLTQHRDRIVGPTELGFISTRELRRRRRRPNLRRIRWFGPFSTDVSDWARQCVDQLLREAGGTGSPAP